MVDKSKKRSAPSKGDVSSVALLRSTDVGGTVSFEVDQSALPDIERLYSRSMSGLSALAFWRAAASGTYRPDKGLWLPQRRAVAFAHAYLAAWDIGVAGGQAALVKMPTGTGKSAVIATLACVSPRVKKVLILTPREGLVSQMRFDLSFRFWGKAFGAVFDGDRLREDVDHAEIERIEKAVTSGRIAPARVLEAAQYSKIIDDADTGKDRQILVGTFNALHRVLGLEPRPIATSTAVTPPNRRQASAACREVPRVCERCCAMWISSLLTRAIMSQPMHGLRPYAPLIARQSSSRRRPIGTTINISRSTEVSSSTYRGTRLSANA